MTRRLTYDDLATLGATFLMTAATRQALGHDDLTGCGIYCEPTDWASQFVLDVVSPQDNAAGKRVAAVLDANATLDLIAEAVTR